MSEIHLNDQVTHRADYTDKFQIGRSLTDRMSQPIQEATVGVTALLSTLIGKSLHTGIEKLEEGLEGAVHERITDDLERRGPELTEAAKAAAKEETLVQLEVVTRRARKTAAEMRKRLDYLEKLARDAEAAQQRIMAELSSAYEQLRGETANAKSELEQKQNSLREDLSSQLQRSSADLAAKIQGSQDTMSRRIAKAAEEMTSRLGKLESGVEQHIDDHSTRLAALEEKVFRPSVIGRIGQLFSRSKPKEIDNSESA